MFAIISTLPLTFFSSHLIPHLLRHFDIQYLAISFFLGNLNPLSTEAFKHTFLPSQHPLVQILLWTNRLFNVAHMPPWIPDDTLQFWRDEDFFMCRVGIGLGGR